ncbi:hypothetical protein Trydic_g13650 [Trypoxylus dichotomus]
MEALRLTSMSAPRLIDYKDDMELDCHFDMGNEELYAVKWYKDDHEFFRFMPHQIPNELSYPVNGVYVEKEGTHCDMHSCHVRLTNLVRNDSSGAYRCEVSSEAPAFRLASETHNVTVAALPTQKPILSNIDGSYFVGDILSVVCDSPPSDPPQQLTWYINDQQVPDTILRDVKPSAAPNPHGLQVKSLQLRFVIESQHSKSGSIVLKCVSAFPGVKESDLSVSKTVSLFDQDTQIINNQKFYWNSSSQAYKFNTYLIVFLGAVRWNTGTINNNSDKTEEFATYFEGTFRPNPPVGRDHEKFTDIINKQVYTEYRDTINVQETTTGELRHMIKALGERKAPGHDGITNTAVKYLTLEAVSTLKEIINGIIKHQYYPKTWKHATIIIIHKSGKPKNKPDGYPPVSLLPGLSKILRRLIQKRLLSVVEERSIIHGFQFGFRREHSTTQQLLKLSEYITSNMDNVTTTATIMLDIERAFDNL